MAIDLVSSSEEISAAIQSAPAQDRIEWTATETQRAMLLERVRSIWSSLGKTAPYWSVFTNPAYQDKTELGAELRNEFYKSDWNELHQLQHVFRRNYIDPDRIKSVIDWGCGLGRVTIPLCKTFGSCLGVDVSSSHIEHARSAATKERLSTARFSLIDDFLKERPLADLAYSLITLQHNPPPLIVFFYL